MGWEDSWQNLTYPLGMCVVLTHNRCGVHMMRTQPLKELISTAILLGFFMPCSRLTQPRLTQKPCSCHYLATSYTSRTTLDFPFSVIVVNGRRTNFPKTTAKKLSVVILFFTINQIHLSFRKDFLWGGCIRVSPKERAVTILERMQCCNNIFRKGTQWRMFSLTRYSWSWYLERQQLVMLTSSFYQECWSRPGTHAAVARFTAKWLSDVGGCCPFKDFGISAFS